MAISERLLNFLVCPETKLKLSFAENRILEQVNAKIKSHALLNRGGISVSEPLNAGLIREDKKLLFPIREGIPVMLMEEAIELP